MLSILQFSRARRPVSRGLIFMPGNVSTCILTVTVRRSLLLTSCSRTILGVSYDPLSLFRNHTGLPRFALQTEWVRFFLFAGALVIREQGRRKPLFLLVAVPFWSELVSTFSSFYLYDVYRKFTLH